MIDATRPKSIGTRPTRPTQQSNFKCGNRKGRGDGRDERDMTLRRQENKKMVKKGKASDAETARDNKILFLGADLE
jgi:hypothetical protein